MVQRPIDIAFETHTTNEKLARYVTRRQRWTLYVAALVLTLAGLIFSWATSDYLWFARSGAALTALSVAMASTAHRLERATHLAEEAWRISGDATAALSDTRALLTSIHRQHIIAHLRMGAVGTVIWGFGDLLGYLFHG